MAFNPTSFLCVLLGLLPGLAAAAERREVPAAELASAPYDAIVKIRARTQISRLEVEEQLCTGALVAPRIVLTAAHCLERGPDGRLPSTQVFTGYRQGRYTATAQVVDVIAPEWVQGTGETAHGDWALLQLDRDLGERLLAVEPVTDLARLAHLRLAGYSGDTAKGEVLTEDPDCAIFGFFTDIYVYERSGRRAPRAVDIVAAHHCKMASGASGAPLVLCEEGTCRMVAVNVAEAVVRGGDNLAVPVSRVMVELALLKDKKDKNDKLGL